jgi:ATP-dependent phosphoenolpyruvate carboxykinase
MVLLIIKRYNTSTKRYIRTSKAQKKNLHNLGLDKLTHILCHTLWLFSYGVGERISLAYTRKIIDAIHSGELLARSYKKTDVFGLDIPTKVEGVPSELLDPINTVSP